MGYSLEEDEAGWIESSGGGWDEDRGNSASLNQKIAVREEKKRRSRVDVRIHGAAAELWGRKKA